MSYIRWGSKLPSGRKSKAFVFGEDTRLINMGSNENEDFATISFVELRRLFRTKTYAEIKEIIRDRLHLEKEEADYVCIRLFDEHRKGEWDKPFDFEKKKKKKTKLTATPLNKRHRLG